MYLSQGSGKGSLKGRIGAVSANAHWLPLEHVLDAEFLVAALTGVWANLAIQLQARVLKNTCESHVNIHKYKFTLGREMQPS